MMVEMVFETLYRVVVSLVVVIGTLLLIVAGFTSLILILWNRD